MATQQEVAAHLFLSDRQIRNLQKLPGAPRSRGRGGYDLDEWRKFYIDYLGGSGPGTYDPDGLPESASEELKRREAELKIEERQERILHARAKRVVFERSYAPLGIITQAVEQTATALYSRLDSILPRLKLVWPEMPVEAQQVLTREIAAASNELADTTIDLSEYVGGDPAGDIDGLASLEEDDPA